MELPHIGEHCSETTCRQLDFLPFYCPHCKKIFCLEHFRTTTHSCPNASSVDAQVPVCPLCNQAVPAPRGQSIDVTISQHLDNNCVVKKQRIFNNKCCFKKCKNKELMPIQCPQCRLNYCIPHRHPSDHDCTGTFHRQTDSNGGSESIFNGIRNQAGSMFGFSTSESRSRAVTNGSSEPGASSISVMQLQGNVSEDEALALALQQSQMTSSHSLSSHSTDSGVSTSTSTNNRMPEGEDAELQRAIALSLQDQGRRRGHQECSVL